MSLLAAIASRTQSLTVAAFDAAAAGAWVPTRPAANKAQFTGHPAEVLRGLGTGAELCAIDVGPAAGVAFELEGASGRLEVHRVDAETLVLVAPPPGWWQARGEDAAALFAELLAPGAHEAADELGALELGSDALAIVYVWHPGVAAAAGLAAGLAAGGVARLAEDAGVVVAVGAGRYRVARREVAGASDAALVAMYLSRE